MSTKLQTIQDPTSCLNKAADDEPVFVLRANDPVAYRCVLLWAALAENFHEPEKVAQAKAIAQEIDAWRAAHQLGG